MAKKVLFVLVFVSVLTGGIFAQNEGEKPKKPISIGAGGFIGGDFGSGAEVSAGGNGVSVKGSIAMPYFGGGGYFFLDIIYAELLVGIYSGTCELKSSVVSTVAETNYSNKLDLTLSNFSIGLFGKYPIGLSNSLSVFPLLGAEYVYCSTAIDKDGNTASDAKDLSALWFKLGGGLDFNLAQKLYLRFEALYGLRLANKLETDTKAEFDEILNEYKAFGISGEAKTLLGHGLTVKLAIGYKL